MFIVDICWVPYNENLWTTQMFLFEYNLSKINKLLEIIFLVRMS